MLYFISNGSHIKVGHSGSPFERVRELQMGSSKRLSILLVLDIQNAKQIEFMMHERLAHYRLEGEWFGIPFSRAFEELLELRSLMHFPGQAELALASPPLPTLAECAEEFKKWWIEKHNPSWDENKTPLDRLWEEYRMDFIRRKADEPSFEENDKECRMIFAKIHTTLRSVQPESD